MYVVPNPFSADTFVSAAVSVVFPWSTCPIVPTFTCGFVRSNFALAMCPLSSCEFGSLGRSVDDRRSDYAVDRTPRLSQSSRPGLNR